MSDKQIWEYASDGNLEGVMQQVRLRGTVIINTALHPASHSGHLPVVQYLVSNGANINHKDGRGTALHLASQKGHLPVVEYLVNNGANINDKDYNGNTALIFASSYGHLPVVEYLVSNGANINYNNKGMYRRGRGDLPTALMAASYANRLPIVQYLISNGANIDDTDSDGRTALFHVSEQGNLSIVEVLVNNGANINDKDYNGNTALILASQRGHLPVVQYLLGVGAGSGDKTDLGYALLSACNPAGFYTILTPDPTVFIYPDYSPVIEVIKTLIANGANETIKSEDNKTPAEKAINATILNALTQAVQDRKNGKLQSYVIKPTAPSSTSAPISTQEVILQKDRELEEARRELAMLRSQFPSSFAASSSSALAPAPAPVPSSTSAFPSNIQYSLPRFSINDLQRATKNFADSNKLGEGGFGSVFKGSHLGTQMAIKKLSLGSSQGEKEFRAEITSLSRFRHPNIVNLIGYSEQGIERCLVYEFVSNGSLRDRLDRKGIALPLTWPQRHAIAVGIAVGMNYLQNADPNAPLFHLDLKSANVLLDSQFQPKLSDFGLTRPLVIGMGENSYVQGNVIEGDVSYICPEYVLKGKVSRKTDVYSYGCILIELVSGKFISNQLRSGIKNVFLRRKDISPFLDSSLRWDDALKTKATEMAFISLGCIDEDRFGRPSFSKILQDLTGDGSEQPVEDAVEDVPERECNICFDGPTDAKFIPCNHAAVCQKCAQELKNHGSGCPICRKQIQGFTIGDYKATFVQ